MSTVLYIIAGPLFLVSLAVHIYVKLRMRPGKDSGLDDYYYEFEDSHPALARYNRWSAVTFACAAAAALLLFLAAVI